MKEEEGGRGEDDVPAITCLPRPLPSLAPSIIPATRINHKSNASVVRSIALTLRREGFNGTLT